MIFKLIVIIKIKILGSWLGGGGGVGKLSPVPPLDETKGTVNSFLYMYLDCPVFIMR